MIKVIIADDEQPSLERLAKLLSDSGMVEVTGKFTEPSAALEFLDKNIVGAAFLDIEMPDMNGIELANRIMDMQKNVAVIFVTAYNQYAVEAFRLNALDYLLKPVSADRLIETLRRITERYDIALQTAGLHVQCFGKFCVTAGGEEIRFRTQKAEELFAFLLENKGEYVSRSRIIDNLWEDFDADRAIVHLNTTLHYIKKALLPFGINILIEFDRGSYRLDTRGLDCDYLEFCGIEESKGIISEENVSELEKAAALYTGEFLSGWDCTWAAGKRLILAERFIRLLTSISGYYKELGIYPEAIKWINAGLAHEPLHRELNYRLIELLLFSHEQSMAVKHYELYRSGIMKRFGLLPDAAFEELFR